MGIKEKFGEFKNFITPEDVDKVEENIDHTVEENKEMAKNHIYLSEPEDFSKTEETADLVKNGNSVVLNLNSLNEKSAQRMIDYLSGVVYALDGDIQSIGSRIVLITPNCTEVHGKIVNNLEA